MDQKIPDGAAAVGEGGNIYQFKTEYIGPDDETKGYIVKSADGSAGLLSAEESWKLFLNPIMEFLKFPSIEVYDTSAVGQYALAFLQPVEDVESEAVKRELTRIQETYFAKNTNLYDDLEEIISGDIPTEEKEKRLAQYYDGTIDMYSDPVFEPVYEYHPESGEITFENPHVFQIPPDIEPGSVVATVDVDEENKEIYS